MRDSKPGTHPDVSAVFRQSGFSLDAVQEDTSVTYSIDGESQIFYCNAAWDRFAADNGAPELSSDRIIGANLFDFIPLALTPFYRGKFDEARAGEDMVQFEYECSSPQIYRVYRMQLFPLTAVDGLLVVNSLKVSLPHPRNPSDPSNAQYLNADGFLLMCCHCRRTKRHSTGAWDWVPSYLNQKKLPVTHTLCSMCLSYFYPTVAKRILKLQK